MIFVWNRIGRNTGHYTRLTSVFYVFLKFSVSGLVCASVCSDFIFATVTKPVYCLLVYLSLVCVYMYTLSRSISNTLRFRFPFEKITNNALPINFALFLLNYSFNWVKSPSQVKWSSFLSLGDERIIVPFLIFLSSNDWIRTNTISCPKSKPILLQPLYQQFKRDAFNCSRFIR